MRKNILEAIEELRNILEVEFKNKWIYIGD